MEPRYPVKLAGASAHVFTCSLGTIDTKLKIYRNDFLIEARSLLTGLRLRTGRAYVNKLLIAPWVESRQCYSFSTPTSTKPLAYITIDQIHQILDYLDTSRYLKREHVATYRLLFRAPDCLQHWAYALQLSQAELDAIMKWRKEHGLSHWNYFERKAMRDYLEDKQLGDFVTCAGYSFKPLRGPASFEQVPFWHSRPAAPKAPSVPGLGPW